MSDTPMMSAVKNGVVYKYESMEELDGLPKNIDALEARRIAAKNSLLSELAKNDGVIRSSYLITESRYLPRVPKMLPNVVAMVERYDEYFNGMMEYVETIYTITPGDNMVEKVNEKLDKAIENDKVFIESLEESAEMTIPQTLHQIEQAVPILKKYGAPYEVTENTDADDGIRSLRDKADTMLCTSLTRFFEKVSEDIILCIESLNTSKKPVAEDEKIPSNAYFML